MKPGWEGRCFGFFLVLGAGSVAVDTYVVDPLVADLIAGPPEWVEDLVTLVVGVFIALGLVLLVVGLATELTRRQAGQAGAEEGVSDDDDVPGM